MLGTRNAVANLAVSDLDRARDFYTGTLGLTQVDNEGDELIVLESGDSVVNVYRSEFAGTNKATAVTWQVDDIGAEVAGLRAKGWPSSITTCRASRSKATSTSART